MKEKILEIQSYFISKLVDGQFDIIRIKAKNKEVTVRIDNEYQFTFKIETERGNEVEQVLGYGEPNFMILPEMTYDQKNTFIQKNNFFK